MYIIRKEDIMKRVIINEEQLDITKMDETVIRVKALMVNEKKELLVVHNNYTYQFPGGHWKEYESLEETLKREIKEETGITITIDRGPFMVIEEYYSNYLDIGKSRCNKIYYYIVHSNEGHKVEEMSLSKLKQKTDFHLFYIPIKDMEIFLKESIENQSIEKVIGKEMLAVMQEYREKHMGGI